MSYRFQSKATGDVLMLTTDAQAVLRVLGLGPAAQGLIPAEAMPAAIRAIDAAVACDEQPRATSSVARLEPGPTGDEAEPVSLRQRNWPLREMLRQAHAAGEPVVWGV